MSPEALAALSAEDKDRLLVDLARAFDALGRAAAQACNELGDPHPTKDWRDVTAAMGGDAFIERMAGRVAGVLEAALDAGGWPLRKRCIDAGLLADPHANAAPPDADAVVPLGAILDEAALDPETRALMERLRAQIRAAG